ncbi:MBL fold metallo-hydrolase [Candidatus Roizmanbacteria bacterium]|nr:MBL fold metallo-hydrolase [Candidatus Roizmanbacteria bacterium]
MDIKFIGHASFFIKAKDARLVTDPYDPSAVGMKFPKIEADIVTVSHTHPDHNYVTGVSGTPLVIDLPGEFEKNGMRIYGYSTFHDKNKGQERGENTVYKVEAEGINVLHCGDLGHVFDDALIEEIGDVDILLVPVGGFFTIDAADAVELAKKLEPAVIIPMHYNIPGLNQKVFAQLAAVTDFLKKMGQESITSVPKLTVKKESLTEEMKVVVMEMGG